MRYILAITGLIFAAVGVFAVSLFLPRSEGGTTAAPSAMAQATPAAPAAPNEASDDGEGSLRVCNQTGNQVSVALGYKAPRGWQSEGWWVAAANECKTVYSGSLDARYYYIFAADDIGGGAWDGTNYMCTRDETFTIFGVEDCLARGYERTGFFEVDTQNKSNWTLQLIDGEVVSGGSDTGEDAVPLEGDLEGVPDIEEPAVDEAPAAEGTDTQ